MINPVRHGDTPSDRSVYKVEPYVLAADVYAVVAARRARRLDLVHRLGRLDVSPARRIPARHPRDGDRLRIDPCIPADWPDYRVRYRHGDTVYRIHVRQSRQAGERSRLSIDGVEQQGLVVPLGGEQGAHDVEVVYVASATPHTGA